MSRARVSDSTLSRAALAFALASPLVIWALIFVLYPRTPQPAPQSVARLAPEPEPPPEPIPGLAPYTHPDAMDILVAAEDVPDGTSITPKNIAKFVSWKRIAKDECPRAAVTDATLLHNTRFWRPVRKGDSISLFDVYSQSLRVPEGKEPITIPLFAAGGGGFYAPGCRVQVIATVRLKKRLEAFIVARDALILAIVDPFPYTGAVLAVDPKEKALIEFVLTRQSHLELCLIHPESPPNTEPVDFDGAKKLLGEAPLNTPTRP